MLAPVAGGGSRKGVSVKARGRGGPDRATGGHRGPQGATGGHRGPQGEAGQWGTHRGLTAGYTSGRQRDAMVSNLSHSVE